MKNPVNRELAIRSIVGLSPPLLLMLVDGFLGFNARIRMTVFGPEHVKTLRQN